MMTIAFAMMAASCFLLWRRKAEWTWALVMGALVLGIIIFVGDVDFGAKLGIQL